MINLDTFTRAYVACALWSSNDGSTPQGGEPFDANYSADDIDPASLAAMAADCAAFRALPLEGGPTVDDVISDDAQGGHDLWLTRNGHGCGFQDRAPAVYGPHASGLAQIARKLGECHLYLGDDGAIYVDPLPDPTNTP